MRKWIAVTAVLLAVAAGAAFLWLGGGADAPRPATFRGEPTTAHYAPIATRAADPDPLTVAEMFPAGPVSAGGTTLTVKGTEALTDCVPAVWGSAEAAVAGCSQALRAHYATPDGRISGQFAVFNLADSTAADRLVAALKDGGFVRPAPGTPAGFDGSRSWAQARALGHYVTVSWVAPVGGTGRVDLTYPQVAMDGLSLVIQRRLVR
ncbi:MULTISPECIES: hypothetical protein [Streptosporangium]|uniref:Uncharacterized protein n=1 Tax=Streptosporangium brasiliense TaxID=47480 RepID=A0ABT9QZ48_9ACTN|nr:hypothetical protein [Streptosporangium brasiliense]MDP9861936.1 hypothetical protein [Streptosporangium brasiliense]